MLFFQLGHLCEGSGSLPSQLGQCPTFHRIYFLKASLIVVASTFRVTCVIFYNVTHQGWLHSKHDYTLRVMARTFHVTCNCA